MNLNAKIKELEEQIQDIKDIQHNHGMRGAAKSLQKEHMGEQTIPEKKI